MVLVWFLVSTSSSLFISRNFLRNFLFIGISSPVATIVQFNLPLSPFQCFILNSSTSIKNTTSTKKYQLTKQPTHKILKLKMSKLNPYWVYTIYYSLRVIVLQNFLLNPFLLVYFEFNCGVWFVLCLI